MSRLHGITSHKWQPARNPTVDGKCQSPHLERVISQDPSVFGFSTQAHIVPAQGIRHKPGFGFFLWVLKFKLWLLVTWALYIYVAWMMTSSSSLDHQHCHHRRRHHHCLLLIHYHLFINTIGIKFCITYHCCYYYHHHYRHYPCYWVCNPAMISHSTLFSPILSVGTRDKLELGFTMSLRYSSLQQSPVSIWRPSFHVCDSHYKDIIIITNTITITMPPHIQH